MYTTNLLDKVCNISVNEAIEMLTKNGIEIINCPMAIYPIDKHSYEKIDIYEALNKMQQSKQ